MSLNVEKAVTGVILIIIGVIVVFQLLAGTSADLSTSATNVSNSGLPLASLFGPSGIILLLLMVGVLLMILKSTMKLGGNK